MRHFIRSRTGAVTAFVSLMLLFAAATHFTARADGADGGAAKAGAGDGSLKTARVSIPAPGEGYTWAKVRDVNQGPVHAQVYLATKEGAEGKAVLVVGIPAPKDDKGRLDMAAGFLDGITQSMLQQGYTAVKPDRSALKRPVPDRVPFTITSKTKDGKPAVTSAVIVFGKKGAYQFQAQAPSEEEAKALTQCLDGLKEES